MYMQFFFKNSPLPSFGSYNIDLLQVNLLVSGVSLVWPRSGRPRATKSREVDLSCLTGCRLHFVPKMESCMTCIWGFRFHFSMAECADSTPTKSIERVCVSPSSKEQICLLCAKVEDLRGPEKNKAWFNLESLLGKEISHPRNP